MFEDSELVAEFPHNGDRENYFPTSRQQKSIDYGPIKGLRDQIVQVTEVHYRLNKLKILDDPTPSSAQNTRETSFINVSKNRRLEIS